MIKFIRRVLRWLKKSFQYSLFLWNDYDWDYALILQLLQYKLKRTRECIVKNDIITDSKIIAKQIKYAEFLIERISDYNYLDKKEEKDWHRLWKHLDRYMRQWWD
ncbi:hypothetical protein HYV49_05240 [Candidatus Pacearchaeota archaeon]|nr:hypothetical protein [Candidatus Pacearchaeota archaeon]